MTRSYFYSIILLGTIVLLTQCKNEPQQQELPIKKPPLNRTAESFSEWKAYYADRSSSQELPSEQTFSWKSAPMEIDTIFRSMKGPEQLVDVLLPGDNDEVVWITGFAGKMSSPKDNEPLSDGYMCHLNLDITSPQELPWKTKTYGPEIRLFTVAEGQTDIHFPEGFGMPLPGNQPVRVFAQALNHNTVGPSFEVIEEMNIKYISTTKEQSHLMTPLFQRAIFAAKQQSGPEGTYGSPPPGMSENQTIVNTETPPVTWCGVSYNLDSYNPYLDNYGRSYSAHWDITPGKEEVRSDITVMIQPKQTTTIHFIGVHMHPFATSLELRDMTDDTSLFKANVTNYEDRIGIKHIDHYSSKEGITIYPDHAYELVSIYECPPGETYTAMAVMYMYFKDDF